MQYFTLKVIDIIKDTSDVITIRFKQPGLKKIKYKAGQYLTLIIRINGRKYLRPYSFSSAPDIDLYLEITIKRIQGGVVSNYLYDHIKVDDIIEVMEPMGDFIYDPSSIPNNQHIMLWGAGSGITPLMSILKTTLNHSPDTKVSLFYCNRNPEHTIFQQEINALKEKFNKSLVVWNFYTGIPEDIYLNYQISGRIDESKIMSVVSNKEELFGSVHYICGPTGLKNTIKAILSKLEVPATNIFTEEFEVLIDSQQLDDIQTRMVTIIEGGKKSVIEIVKGKSILDSGLDQDMDLSYSCQTGTCTLCKAKLLSGKVKVIGVDKMPDDVAEDECLLCCSYPYTDDIIIQI